jgi:TetR/AcrR family transcriptional regulator, transcriptional repressor for nem operon
MNLRLLDSSSRNLSTSAKYDQDNILLAVAKHKSDTRIGRCEEGKMPYAKGHREEVRVRIVDSARGLFNRHGFDNVSVAKIMAGVGLTHGGFYSYFESKSDLYAEVLGCFFTHPEWRSRWEGVKLDLSSDDVGPQVVKAYLSQQHFENVENSCPMVALPTDVSRSGTSAKQAFEIVFQGMVRVLERGSKENKKARRIKAQAIAALCVGGMVVARAMLNRELADQLRAASMKVALQLGGWSQQKRRKSK